MQTTISIESTSDKRGLAEARRKARYRVAQAVRERIEEYNGRLVVYRDPLSFEDLRRSGRIKPEGVLWYGEWFEVGGQDLFVLNIEGQRYFDGEGIRLHSLRDRYVAPEGVLLRPFGTIEDGLGRIRCMLLGRPVRPTQYPKIRARCWRLGKQAWA